MDLVRPDIVCDCNVFLQAIIREAGPAAAILRLVGSNGVRLHLSRPILRELRRALNYPELRRKNPALTDDVADSFVARLRFRGVVHQHVPRVFDHPRDPQDEPYLDLASAVLADFLVTRDNDLLYLTSDPSVQGKQLRQRLPSLSILDPASFMEWFNERR